MEQVIARPVALKLECASKSIGQLMKQSAAPNPPESWVQLVWDGA